MITHCQICKREFWKKGVTPLLFDSRYCDDCAIKACEAYESKLSIGDIVIDEDGCQGVVGIRYVDGDFVFWPGGNDAAHPNPKRIKEKP